MSEALHFQADLFNEMLRTLAKVGQPEFSLHEGVISIRFSDDSIWELQFPNEEAAPVVVTVYVPEGGVPSITATPACLHTSTRKLDS